MRLHRNVLRRTRNRRGRNVCALSAAVLALFFAFTLWPCCEVLASSLLQPRGSGLPQHHDDGAMPGPDSAPGPCAWMDASDVALPEVAPVARTAFGAALPALLDIERTALIQGPVLPYAWSSRGPPRPRYLGLLRLLL